MTAYGTDHDARQLAALARHFPGAEVADPAELWATDEEWLAEWPAVLASLDLLVLWADEAGYIGAGVLKEVVDAVGAFVPVVALDRRGRLRYFGGVRVARGLVLSRSRVGRLLCGPALSGEAVAGLAGRVAYVATTDVGFPPHG